MGPAIHDVGDAIRCAAGHRNRRRRIVLVRLKVGRWRGSGQPRKQDQLRGLPAIERQLDDSLVVDDLTDPGAARLDERRTGGHGDHLAQNTNLQFNVELRIRAYLQNDAFLQIRRESVQRDLKLIRTRGKVEAGCTRRPGS